MSCVERGEHIVWVVQEEGGSFSHLPDGQLVQHALSGDERAFEVLVGRYCSSLFQRIASRLRDYDAACDVLQQVLVQLYLSLPSLNQEHSLKPWLSQVTRSKIIDEVRRKRWVSLSEAGNADEEEALLLLLDPDLSPEEQLDYQELQHQVKEAIATLPERYQQVVILRYLVQLPFSEIGRLVGIPQATAKTHFQRARPLLRAAFHAKHIEEFLPGR
jgi:RNA polymerase sigma-70 factor (ECF subfamily)